MCQFDQSPEISEGKQVTLELELQQAGSFEGLAVSLHELLHGGEDSGMYTYIHLIRGLVIVVTFHEG